MSSDTPEGLSRGAGAVAWRLLAALEGAAMALAVGAVITRALRRSLRQRLVAAGPQMSCKTVLISNDSQLGNEIRKKLEARGCAVHTITGGDESGATSGAVEAVDALVIVGASEHSGLDGLSNLVSQDVSYNLKVLEKLAPRVRRGGSIVWASTSNSEAVRGAFSEAGKALSDVVNAQLDLVANSAHCKAVWLGRCDSREERVAERVVSMLLPHDRYHYFRNTAANVGAYIGRWLKIIS